MQSYLTIHLQLQGFSDAEFQKLDSILALAEARLDATWTLSHSGDADVVLVSDVSLLPEGDSRPCIYYTKNDSDTVDNAAQGLDVWSLTVDENQVPHLWQLTKIFNAVAENFNQAREAATPEANDIGGHDIPTTLTAINQYIEPDAEKHIESDKLDAQTGIIEPEPHKEGLTATPPESELLALLQSDGENDAGGVFRVRFATGECFAVDLVRDLYFYPLQIETISLCFKQSTAFEVRPVSTHTLDTEAEEMGFSGQPLSHLRWYIALMSPSLHLRDQLADKTVKLKRWPDLGLPGCTPLIRLAAFMQSNVASVKTVAEKTETPVDEVCAFLNACAQEDLVIFGDQEAIHEKPVAADFKSLLSRISDRINAE